MRLTEFRICALQPVLFANHFVILLMSRWRAILSAEYMSVSASTPIQYSTANAPLVGTCKERTFPDFSENVLYISLIFVLHTCCICVAYHLKSNTFDNFPQPFVTLVNWAFLEILVYVKLSL